MKYNYFVSYALVMQNGGSGFSNTKITIDSPINDYESILAIEKYITNMHKFKNVVIINYVLLSQ